MGIPIILIIAILELVKWHLIVVFLFFRFFCLFVFLGLHLQYVEVPRLGVESHLQLSV